MYRHGNRMRRGKGKGRGRCAHVILPACLNRPCAWAPSGAAPVPAAGGGARPARAAGARSSRGSRSGRRWRRRLHRDRHSPTWPQRPGPERPARSQTRLPGGWCSLPPSGQWYNPLPANAGAAFPRCPPLIGSFPADSGSSSRRTEGSQWGLRVVGRAGRWEDGGRQQRRPGRSVPAPRSAGSLRVPRQVPRRVAAARREGAGEGGGVGRSRFP